MKESSHFPTLESTNNRGRQPNPIASRWRNGVYYTVLADMEGWTKFAVEMKDLSMALRAKAFVDAALLAHKRLKPINQAHVVITAGDAVLMLFNYFPDVVRWWMEVDGALSTDFKQEPPISVRACVHIGEVYSVKGNPVGLAVNQTFKMEAQKLVPAGQMWLTEAAYQVAQTSLVSKQCDFEHCGVMMLPGYPNGIGLRRLVIKNGVAFLMQTTNPYFRAV